MPAVPEVPPAEPVAPPSLAGAEGAHTCPTCGALHTRAVRFCEQCGAPFARRTARLAGSPEPSLDREGRRLAHAALLRARTRLGFVRGVLWLSAIVNVLSAPLLFLVRLHVLGVVSVALALVAVLGARTLHRYPLGWTLGCAALQTLSVAAHFVDQGEVSILGIAFALLLWTAVPVTARAARILREHADLYGAEDLRKWRSRGAPKAAARERVEQERVLERRARLGTLAIAASMLVVAGVGGTLALRALSEPRERAPRIDAFRAALATGDAAAGEALCTDAYRGASWRKVATILEREGWLPGGVTVGVPEVLREGERFAEVRFALPRGDMRTMWQLVERDWCLAGVVFRGVRED